MTKTGFAWPEGKRAAVSLTFDDARLTQPDVGIPILDRFGVKATFYVTPRNMSERLDAWKSAVRAGHEIGNHTVTHPCSGNYSWSRDNALEDYTLERMEKELLDANAVIAEMFGVTPRTFAYPCAQTFVGRGENTRSYVPLVTRHFRVGRHALSSVPADAAFCDLAQVDSIELDRKAPNEAIRLIETAATGGSWLIFYAHEIAPDGRQAVPPETLEAVCEFCTDTRKGIWIDTVASVGEHVRRARERQ